MKASLPYKAMMSHVFNKEFKKHIQKTIDQSEVFVLCDKDDPKILFSFIVGSRVSDIVTLHFCYTKSVFWKMGLMKKLVSETFPEVIEHGCVYTTYAPALHSPEWFKNEKPFQLYLEFKYGFLFNPFAEGA